MSKVKTLFAALASALGVFVGYFFGRVVTLGTGTPAQGLAIGAATEKTNNEQVG